MADFRNDTRVCPYCGNEKSEIGESMAAKGSGYLYRRRTCKACGQGWRTYEIHAEEFKHLRGVYNGVLKLAEKYGGDDA